MYSSRTVALKGGLQRFLKPLIGILKINLSWIQVENFIRSLRCLHKEFFFQSIRHHLHWLTHVHCLHPDCKQQRTATWIRKLPLQVLFSPQHNIHQPSQQQKISSLKSSLVTIKTSETQKKAWWTESGSRNRTAFEWSAAWMDPKEEMCWDCSQTQRCEGSGWSLLASGGILQGLQFSCATCLPLGKGKAARNVKVSLKTTFSQPSFPVYVFPSSQSFPVGHEGEQRQPCCSAGVLGLSWFWDDSFKFSQSLCSAAAADPLHFLKNTESL